MKFATLIIAFFAVLIAILFQNCGAIKIAAVSQNTRLCVLQTLKIDQDSPAATSTRFFVSDENDAPVNQSFDWSIEGQMQTGQGSDFTFATSTLTQCQTYKVHAKYQDCSEQQDLEFNYTQPGPACQPPTEPPVTAGCPATIAGDRTLRTTSDLQWGLVGTKHFNYNITEWNNIYGHNAGASDGDASILPAPAAWPGVSGSFPIYKIAKNNYVGIHFKTPPATATAGMTGSIINPSAVGGPDLTASISRQCGDFSVHLPSAGCLRQAVPTSDSNLMLWKFTSNAPSSWCNLAPDTDYYLNIMITDPQQSVENCTANTPLCYLSTTSMHN